jgi:hypothetical protein
MLRYDILVRLESRKGGAHKAPSLYRFDLDKYDKALKEGLNNGCYKRSSFFFMIYSNGSRRN